MGNEKYVDVFQWQMDKIVHVFLDKMYNFVHVFQVEIEEVCTCDSSGDK